MTSLERKRYADDVSTTLQLADLRNQSAPVTWRLKVAALEGADIGKLNYWSLRISLINNERQKWNYDGRSDFATGFHFTSN